MIHCQRAGHPHAGGENAISGGGALPPGGPSPRGWGKRSRSRAKSYPRRAIPTRVGKTLFNPRFDLILPGHPHAGGENFCGEPKNKDKSGPSPRGWGKHAPTVSQVRALRAIPTRVGKTESWTVTNDEKSGHPHAGGENDEEAQPEDGWGGPSPRGWGKHNRRFLTLSRLRAIPTRVGKTFSEDAFDPENPGHPHAGGENPARCSGEVIHGGPSPRGWGKRSVADSSVLPLRAIPTRVGKTRPK